MSIGISNLSFMRRAFQQKRIKSTSTMTSHKNTWRDYALIVVPYLWMSLFFLLPFLIIFKISMSVAEIAIPPYSPLVTFEEGAMQIILHLENYTWIFTDPEGTYIRSYLKSLQVAAFSTFFCLLLGYPIAWALATAKPAVRNVLFIADLADRCGRVYRYRLLLSAIHGATTILGLDESRL